jgi:hypothetical protein
MTRLWALAIAVIPLAACDQLLLLEDIHPKHDARSADAPPDAPPDAASEVLCMGDDFNHSQIDPTLWKNVYSNAPSSISDDGATLLVLLGSNAPGDYSGVGTAPYNFSHMRTVIEVDQIPGQTGATAELSWSNGTNDRLDIYADGNTLYFGQILSTLSDEQTLPYDSTQMRWWQIRHDRDAIQVAFDVSPDGSSWTTLRTVFPSASISLATITVQLQAGTYQLVPSPGNARFDNFAMIGTCQ